MSWFVFIKNHSYHSVWKKIPFHLLYGKKPDVSYLRTFRCKAFMKIGPKCKLGKLKPKAIPVLVLGYSPGVKGYKVLDLAMQWTYHAYNIVFMENQSLDIPTVNEQHHPEPVILLQCEFVPAPIQSPSPTLPVIPLWVPTVPPPPEPCLPLERPARHPD